VTESASEAGRVDRVAEMLKEWAVRTDPPVGRWWIWVATPLLVVLTWPLGPLEPTVGLDPSWRLGLHIGVNQGLDHGSDLLFTYGPLGYLAVPTVAYTQTGLQAVLFGVTLHSVLVFALLSSSRRFVPAPLAILATYAVAWLLFDRIESALVVALLVGAAAIQGAIEERRAPLLLGSAGMVCAILLLVKLNVGLGCLAIGLLSAWWLRPMRWRAVATFSGAALGGLIIMWLASGGSLPDVIPFLVEGLSSVSGYSAAMFTEQTGRDWEVPAFWALVTALAVLLTSQLPGMSRPRATCLALAVGVFAFLQFKHGFVRHDGHSVGAFAAMTAVPLAIIWTSWRRVGAALLVVVAIAFTIEAWQTPGPGPEGVFSPVARVEAAVSDARTVVSGARRSEARMEARQRMRDAYAVPPRILQLIGRDTVHIDPAEAGAAWAYGLKWGPVPVFQSYAAYTQRLDDANARRLASDAGPQFVLRRADGSIDGHLHEHESPRYQIELACRYREAAAEAGWQLLERAENRCGEPVQLEAVSVAPGESIPVPAVPEDQPMIVAAEISPAHSIVDRLRTALYRPNGSTTINVDGRVTPVAAPLIGQPLMISTPRVLWGTPGFPGQLSAGSLAVGGVRGPVRVVLVGLPVLR
jgi:hypothetical protein